MRLMWFSYKVVYVPGKLLSTADALSRSPVSCVDIFNSDLCFEVENHVDNVVAYLPASNNMLAKIRNELLSDPVCSLVIKYCENEWPSQSCIGHDLQPFTKCEMIFHINGVFC